MNLTADDMPYARARLSMITYRVASEINLTPVQVTQAVRLFTQYDRGATGVLPWQQRAVDWHARLVATLAALDGVSDQAPTAIVSAWADLLDDLLDEHAALVAAGRCAPAAEVATVTRRELLREPPALRGLLGMLRTRAALHSRDV